MKKLSEEDVRGLKFGKRSIRQNRRTMKKVAARYLILLLLSFY